MRKSYLLGFLLVLIPLLTACDNMERSERLIYEKPAPSVRCVLLEDFTGQRCVNCPKGAEIIDQLLAEYGENVVAVGIHGGPLGFSGGAAGIQGLATEVGDEYYEHWNLEYQPVGLVNRRYGAVNYTDWISKVKEELAKPAPLTLTATAWITGQVISTNIHAYGTEGTTTGKLQVWLLEDNITAIQLMPDGSANRDYVHNHVLRTPVNGTWGEDINVIEAVDTSVDYMLPYNAAWDPHQLSIVAFVYNDSGVQQAVKCKVEMMNETE